MPDEPNAKKLIRKALKRGSKDLDALRTLVVGQLVDAGKSEKKATKVFEAKLALPLFATAADGTVSLAGAAPAPTQASAAAKRKGDKAAPEPSAKKAKKAAAAGGKAAAGSSSGGAGAVRMMDAAAAAAYCEQNSVTLTGRGADAFRPLAGFADSGFGADALAAVAKFERPTPIQAVCWPVIAAGRDVVGVAETGSGKTLAFFLPAVSLLQAAAGKAGGGGAPSVRMLCLEPTRELAMQTEEVCAAAGKACGIASVCIYGGVPKGPQTGALKRGAQVVIATPGRLLDLYQNDGAVDLSRLEYLVLDEADRMLDMGFEPQIRKIVLQSEMPPAEERQTLVFSATHPPEMKALALDCGRDYVSLTAGPGAVAGEHVAQRMERVAERDKDGVLIQLVEASKEEGDLPPTLVFVSSKRRAEALDQKLHARGIDASSLHGEERDEALAAFVSGQTSVLLATDAAVRGVDVPDVAHVVNFDFPSDVDAYLHRIGRTGRAGAKGEAHTFMDGQKDGKYARALCEIMVKAEQAIPGPIAQMAGLRSGTYRPYDDRSALQPHPSGGMMTAQAAQMAATIPQAVNKPDECGDFKRGNCQRGARCKYSHGGQGGGGGGFGGGFGGGGGYGGGGYGGGGYGGGGGGYGGGGGGYGGGGYGGGGRY